MASETTTAAQKPDPDTSLEPDSAEPSEPSRTPSDGENEEEAKKEGESLDPEWVEERFRIDRKKLESMLYAPKHGDVETGEEFFQRVMKETHTQVKWPSKLKVGAKSKKDPHVKVEGKRSQVLEAKRKILDVLETRGQGVPEAKETNVFEVSLKVVHLDPETTQVNKVTLKMDVAHTEHSHVIGKGGGNIKKVMEVTSCHIHFPDSNRHNAAGEKSNQVSVAGPVEGVEEARRRIRDLQPLALTFDLPVSLAPPPDAGSPLIQQVVQSFGVSVTFRSPQQQSQPAFYGSCCTVWGLQGNTDLVKKATGLLMDLLLGSEVTGVLVSSQLDVTSQQHLFLLGQNGAHFMSVMHQTQTQIVLPDLRAPQNPPSLLIQGSPDGVCVARQQLMDCLPVCLMFDMRDDADTGAASLARMMQSLGVFISVKPKVKQTNKSVVVKGLERNVASLYEARRQLLRQESPGGPPGKMTFDLPPAGELTHYWLNMLLQQLRLSETSQTPEATKPRPSPPPGLSPPEDARAGKENRHLEKILENEDQPDEPEDDRSAVTSSEPCDAEVVVRTALPGRRGSLQGPEFTRVLQLGRRHSTGQALTYRAMNVETERVRSERRNSLRRDVATLQDSCDSCNDEDHDYERKKLLATRAMQQKPVVTEVRKPTDTWSGLGFSKSMPAEAVKELRNISRRSYKPYLSSSQEQAGKTSNGSDSDNWRERRGSFQTSSTSSSSSSSSPSSPPSIFSSSASAFPKFSSRGRSDNPENFHDEVTSSRRTSVCSQRSSSPQMTLDLCDLLSQLGLIKYIHVFDEQEIDFQTFLTLSDEDLKEVGISTFGARRKMLMSIAELNKRRSPDAPALRYLEGGASGRLPRIVDLEGAPLSNRW